MKFIKCEEKLPNAGQIVLVKLTPDSMYREYCDYAYYVCRYTNEYRDNFRFEEAGGEQYSYYDIDEVAGWMPIEELDKIEVN